MTEKHGWKIVPCQPVAECPGCGFTMGIDHTDEPDGDSYTCPVCKDPEPVDMNQTHLDLGKAVFNLGSALNRVGVKGW